MRLDYRRTLILGFGFFAISLSWALYNAFVPVFLDTLLVDVAMKGFLVGAIMTFDNIAAVTLQPFFGAASDRTWNRYGRRMPYILVGMPLGALFFALIPAFRSHLYALIVVLVLMNVSMTVFRAPTVALMPDITPPPLRSKANGVINLMGGFGALLAFFLGSQLYRISPALPFVFGGVVMVLVTLLLRRQIVEPATVEGSGEAKGSVGILSALREVWADPDDSARAMLAAIFFWFVGWSGIEAFFTLYGREMWGISEAAGAFYLGFFSLSLMVFAVPAGFVGTGIGRGRTIRIGLACLVLALFALALIGRESLAVPALRILTRMFGGSITEAGYPAIVEWVLVRLSLIMPILLAFAGASWALININSYPMVVDMASRARTGAFTGLYYLFSSLAAISGPPVFGLLRDLAGMRVVFPFAMICAIVAFVFMKRVRRGEPPASESREDEAV